MHCLQHREPQLAWNLLRRPRVYEGAISAFWLRAIVKL